MFSKKKLLSLICILLLGTGCAAGIQPNAKLTFYTPSKISVIQPGSKVKLISRHNFGYNNSSILLRDVETEINKKKYFNAFVSENSRNQKPDYLINIDNFIVYRSDQDDQKKYNKKFIKKQNVVKNDNGDIVRGYETIEKIDSKSSTATLITAVSIYRASNLEPLSFFNTVSTYTAWKTWREKLDSEKSFEKKLSRNIVVKIADSISSGKKKVGVVIPTGGDSIAKNLLETENYEKAKERLKSILLSLMDLMDYSPLEIKKQYKLWEKQAEAAKKEGKKPVIRSMEEDITNYYLYLMALESDGISEKSLQKIHNGYITILRLTNDSQLIKACAYSLGRVEVKGKRIKSDLFRF
ncbi:conserved exported hypothetical protein [Candidatus Magnetomoraceae bacterium gMMP-1]